MRWCLPIATGALLLALDALAGGTAGGQGAAPQPARDATPWLLSPQLLGDPAGWRSQLETSGVALQLFYNQFFGWRARGGVDPGDGLGASGTYDFFAGLDLEELVSRPGLQILLQAKGAYGRNINDEVGALSDPVDDADFDEAIYLDQLWIQQSFWSNRALLRVGFLEQQNAFDRNAFANNEDRQFATAFLDNNPLVPLPNALGVVALISPFPWLDLALGVSDADNKPRNAGFHTAFDGLDSLTELLEATLHVDLPARKAPLPGSYRFGAFRDGSKRVVYGSSRQASGQPRTRRGHYGAFFSFDQMLYREVGEEGQGLGVFGRMGFADEDVNRLEWFGSLGVQYRGLVPGRDEDVLGVGGYYAGLSDRSGRGRPGAFSEEHGIEIYYRIATFRWLFVTPQLQYIGAPSGDRTVDDAIIALLRFRVAL